ncbi:MAG: hypothetical protein DHS20C02_03770 [Micavibrio sp.]|nr:MAG: hypothetical protein DHS20C02_03770 [Micavibrio sp.]
MTENKKTILLVDDELDVRLMLGDRLASLGYSVVTTEDVPGALEAMKANKIDLVLSDYDLKQKLNGLDFLKVCRQSEYNYQGPFFLGSSYHQDDLRKECERLSVEPDDIIRKPYDYDGLKLAIEKALSSSDSRAAPKFESTDEEPETYGVTYPTIENEFS